MNILKGVLLELKADIQEGVSVCISHCVPIVRTLCIHTLLEVKADFLKGQPVCSSRPKKLVVENIFCKMG